VWLVSLQIQILGLFRMRNWPVAPGVLAASVRVESCGIRCGASSTTLASGSLARALGIRTGPPDGRVLPRNFIPHDPARREGLPLIRTP
jgi:hypothetical protein